MAGGRGSIWRAWKVRALWLSRHRVAGFGLILLLFAAVFVGDGATGPLLALKIAVYLACASLLFAGFLAGTAADVRADTWPHTKWPRYLVYGGQLLVSLEVLYFVPLSSCSPCWRPRHSTRSRRAWRWSVSHRYCYLPRSSLFSWLDALSYWWRGCRW